MTETLSDAVQDGDLERVGTLVDALLDSEADRAATDREGRSMKARACIVATIQDERRSRSQRTSERTASPRHSWKRERGST